MKITVFNHKVVVKRKYKRAAYFVKPPSDRLNSGIRNAYITGFRKELETFTAILTRYMCRDIDISRITIKKARTTIGSHEKKAMVDTNNMVFVRRWC